MKKQKNKFWLFLFSLCPGAGHMYMGLMRMGLSFLLGFMLLIAVTAITGIDVLAVLPLTLYIYSFFHANNIGGMDAEQFAALEDEYFFGIGEWDFGRFQLGKKNRNIVAAACIVLGICMLWNVGFGMLRDYVGWDNPYIRAVYYTMRDEVPRIIIAIGVIWVGVRLLRGKEVDAPEDGSQREVEPALRPAAALIAHEEKGPKRDGQKSDTPDVEVAAAGLQSAEEQSMDEEKDHENKQEEGSR